jgi:hypothetical protein
MRELNVRKANRNKASKVILDNIDTPRKFSNRRLFAKSHWQLVVALEESDDTYIRHSE